MEFEEIVDLIESRATRITGNTLQVGGFADQAPDLCSAIKEVPGDQLHYSNLDTDRLDYRIRVITRGKDYLAARKEAYHIYASLVPAVGVQFPPGVNDREILSSEGGLPADIGRDDKGRWLFSANYLLRIADK